MESLVGSDPNATFDKILNMEDHKIAKVIGKHIEDVRDRPLSNEEWEQLEKAISAIKKISAKVYSNGLQAPEALYRAAERNDFDRALVEEGILDEKDVAMIKQVFAEISSKKIEEKPKLKQAQKQVKEEPKSLPEDAKLEVLSILQALEFADYSESAKEKALQKLASMLEELSKEKLTAENLQRIGLVAFALEIIKRGEFERAEEIKRL
ncbi:hypothetical protein A3K92_00630 [Thermococcus gorgonarius]|uniref:Uncharacterized protein n=1 Tax=Thermococcus gorgonarius TaxID=71997 RepID=A0A2Z2M6X2_THEGO|nr:hypothetical protein A3K92_00630 [Thermococcus gorgonarius]